MKNSALLLCFLLAMPTATSLPQTTNQISTLSSHAAARYPSETDRGIWHEFTDSFSGLKILLPSFPEKLHHESPSSTVRVLEAYTARATYRLMIRKLDAQPDNKQIEHVLEDFLRPGT